METITKYKNRKLYSTTKKQYVNLDDIFDLIKSGGVVQVTKHKTNEDVTQQVLTEAVIRYGNLTTEQLITLARG
jgi:polyhydroxyalkanoate synthesis regulator protein